MEQADAGLVRRKRRRIVDLQMEQGGDPPPADPNIGLAAKEQADTGAAQLQIGEDQLAYQKENDAKWAPFYEKLANQQFDTSADAADRATTQWNQYTNTFVPIENQVASDATNWDSTGGIADARAAGIASNNTAFDQSDAITARNMARSGISASSGRNIETMNENENARALGGGAAATTAATTREMQGIALRQQAASLGRGISSGGDATGALSLSAGGAATGVLGAQESARLGGLSAVSGLYSAASNSYGQSASTLNGLFSQQMAGYNATQSRTGALVGAGATIGAAALAFA